MKYLAVMVIALALIMQLHNAAWLAPEYGFDGKGHIEYLEYIKQNRALPLPHEGWQFYQTPLYYLLATPIYTLAGVKGVQLQNVISYALYLAMIGWGVKQLFPKEKELGIVGMLTIAALPVANYLVPMVSNEFLNDLVMGMALIMMMVTPLSRWMIGLLVVGFYTKYTVLTLGPPYLAALLTAEKKINYGRIIRYGSIFALLIAPIVLRNVYYYKTPLAMAESFFPFPPGREERNLSFFTDLSWIGKADLFEAQHYSIMGGTWNSFWHDGYRTVVPVVTFHKKAFGLWLLGFPLLILSIIGWIKIKKTKPKVFVIGIAYLITAIVAYVLYNFHLPYPSELKAFFMSGLPIIYMLGIVSSYMTMPKLRKIILLLLLCQFDLMISYFWIQPWWHITKSY